MPFVGHLLHQTAASMEDASTASRKASLTARQSHPATSPQPAVVVGYTHSLPTAAADEQQQQYPAPLQVRPCGELPPPSCRGLAAAPSGRRSSASHPQQQQSWARCVRGDSQVGSGVDSGPRGHHQSIISINPSPQVRCQLTHPFFWLPSPPMTAGRNRSPPPASMPAQGSRAASPRPPLRRPPPRPPR